MRAKFELGGIILPYSLGGVVLLGSILSAYNTTDTRWLGWHFSRLGEGGALSANIFNLTLMISGVIMFIIALNIRNKLLSVKNKKYNYKRAASIYFMMLSVISLCLLLLANFPFDKNPVVHNIAGYSMLLTSMLLAFYSSSVLPIFSEKYLKSVRYMIISILAMYILFFLSHSLSLLLVELAIFFMIFLWLISFVNQIYKLEQK